ncbi:hypothetical protein AGDE_00637 [Angomonas deanei]|uniref:FHA domain containing protein, putative n=1 Tax=Angomonas deanei TaxID=59799 RepID=S9U0K9_9TRYP|nr:hypothetical protein AGDE_12421 [Angomonas deanei]EPY42978.1 hypothetical protein AGDE_00945 [Angomonas deanei]EPY43285.1 hypothetical protein AGDE_00637 [Angomonas deanei]CAD2214766.1 FHA domain containing protein, putative [Angomonas deanei]|eukprot:EPY24292.1 hypothetical protein AGDE_12421 [Angomonas deanei]
MTDTNCLCLVGDFSIDRLREGKNVIGRNSVPVEGVSFVNIDAVSVSRIQACIDVASNQDAWLCDCKSTNGTTISVKSGEGIRLQPDHYYQLTSGNKIVFGDVIRFFVEMTNEEYLKTEKEKAALVVEQGANTAHTDRVEDDKGPVIPSNVTVQRSDISKPYLDNDQSDAEREEVEPSKRRRMEEEPPAPPVVAQSVSFVLKDKFNCCVSGMGEEEYDAAVKTIRKSGGKVVETVDKADILVVGTPAKRTPKFIVAVGTGIPVVSIALFSDKDFRKTVEHHVVSLEHEGVVYSSALLRSTTLARRETPILSGRTYNIAGVPAKAKGAAEEIITGCGGTANKRKNLSGEKLDETSLAQLFDGILRNTVKV